MSNSPEIKDEYLDEDFTQDAIREIQRAAMHNDRLAEQIEKYNRAAEQTEDAEFYQRKLWEIYEQLQSTNKVAEVQQAMSQQLQQGQVQDIQTPVLKGVVVNEYDGKRIWIEPESAIKGQYGVKLPTEYTEEELQVGTEVAVDPQTFAITDVLDRKKDAQFIPAATNVTFSDIGGLDNVIEVLKKNIGVQLDENKRVIAEDWDVELDNALLFVGRPGTGKTMLAKALANEFDAEIFTINAPRLVEKFIGEGAKKIKKLYTQAGKSDKPAIIFIDEIDAIAKTRDGDRRHGGEEVERTMSQLLSELDGLDKEEGTQHVVSIFATNKPSVLDPAILNRCAAIEVPIPGANAKADIFKIHTRKMPVADDIDFERLGREVNEDYTGRDIAQICKQAAITALSRDGNIAEATVTTEDFDAAIRDMEEGKLGMEADFLVDSTSFPGEIFA